MEKTLRFRRQFILARESLDELSYWQLHKVADSYLYVHPDLDITTTERSTVSIVLLGYIFDPFNPEKTNKEIVSDIMSKVDRFDDFIPAIKAYTGRYAFIYNDEHSFIVLHDPLGVREINYCTEPNKIICGSQPNLINDFSQPPLGITKDEKALYYYEHDMKQVRSGTLWIGDDTYFHCVKQLLPNHFLDVNVLTARRYWPNRLLEQIDVKTAVDEACRYLEGALEAVTTRYDCMMAVTAGVDSRSLLAASKDFKDKIYYFINRDHPLTRESPDIRIPSEMLKRFFIPFHIHDIDGEVDEEFKNYFRTNTFLYKEYMLSTVHNVYYKNHQNKVNLLGLGELGRDYSGETPSDIDGYYLARSLKFKNSQYAVDECDRWLRETRDTTKEYNVDIMKLFVWEILIGNWAVVGNSESDIAIEEYDPYSSHYLYEIMFSLAPEHLKDGIFDEMFRQMWPELLEYPFNPPDRISEHMKTWLRKFGLFDVVKRQIYKFDRRKYEKQKRMNVINW